MHITVIRQALYGVGCVLWVQGALAIPPIAAPRSPTVPHPLTFATPATPNAPADLTLPLIPVEPSPTEGLRFVLKAVRFSGNTVVSETALQTLVAPFIGQAMSSDEVETLRQRVTQYYIDQGYLNSGAVLPDQPVQDGVLVIQIVEGRLTDIPVHGTERLKPAYIADRLWRGATPPFNMNRLAEQFQRLLDDPLMHRMDGRLRPGDVPGESILDITVERAKPYALSLSFDNFATPSSSSERLGAAGTVRNLTGYGDAWNGTWFQTRGSADTALDFNVPITAQDTRLGFHVERLTSEVITEPFKTLDIFSKSHNYAVSIEHPWWNALNRRLIFGAQLAYRETQTTILTIPYTFSPGAENGQSNVAALRLTQEFIDRDARQSFSARSTFSMGLHALDATIHHDDRADSRFFAWLGQAQYARRIGEEAQVIARLDMQLSNDAVLSQEKFALGGATTVRGYRENALVRDTGYLGSLELRYPVISSNTAMGLLEAALFTDYGAGWSHAVEDDCEFLWSAGVGFLWTPTKRVNAKLYLAHDLLKAELTPGHNWQDDGFHFSLSADVF